MATYTYELNPGYSEIKNLASFGFLSRDNVNQLAKENIPAYSTITNVKLEIDCRQGFRVNGGGLYIGPFREGDTVGPYTYQLCFIISNASAIPYETKRFSTNDSDRTTSKSTYESNSSYDFIDDLTTIFQSGTADAGCLKAGWENFQGFVFLLSFVTARRIECSRLAITWTYTPPTYYTITVNAGTGGTVSGGGSYRAGTTATITATPSSGYSFVSWNDGNTSATRTVTVNSNVTYTATFKLNKINKIYVGNKQPKVYIGNTEAKAVYVGNTKIYG